MSTTIYVKISLKFNALKVDKIDIRTYLKQKKTKGLTLKTFFEYIRKKFKRRWKIICVFHYISFSFQRSKKSNSKTEPS